MTDTEHDDANVCKTNDELEHDGRGVRIGEERLRGGVAYANRCW